MPINEQAGSWHEFAYLARFNHTKYYDQFGFDVIGYSATQVEPFVSKYVGIRILRDHVLYYGWLQVELLLNEPSDYVHNIDYYGYDFGYQITKIAIQTDPTKTILPGQTK